MAFKVLLGGKKARGSIWLLATLGYLQKKKHNITTQSCETDE